MLINNRLTPGCRLCTYVGEDIAGGTNQLFCNNPDIDWFPEESSPLNPHSAERCEAYELDKEPGLYFHELPEEYFKVKFTFENRTSHK